MGGDLTEKKQEEKVYSYNVGELNLNTVNVIERTRIVEVPDYKTVEVINPVLKDKEIEVPVFKNVEVKRCIIKDEDITPLVEQAAKKILAKFEARVDKLCSDMVSLIPNIENAVKTVAEKAAKDIVSDISIKIEADTKLKVE
jgi:hypothetical protein